MSYITMDKDMIMVPSLSVTREEFCRFHNIDRALYAVLVIDLARDPIESMVVIALFLWLERKGLKNVVTNALKYPHPVINELANEAVTCLKCVNVITCDHSASSSTRRKDDLPFMRKFIDKEITDRFFFFAGEEARKGVCDVFGKVCMNALLDIMQAAIMARADKSPEHLPAHASSSRDQPQFEASLAVPAEDRTLFVTFSKGYPVQEWEVRDFLMRAYGDCIEALHMQEVPMFEQSLFARVVFRSAATINLILDASGKAKFVINGKHVWARKFIPKRNKINELFSPRTQFILPPSFPYSI